MRTERLRGGICIGDSADPRCKRAAQQHPESILNTMCQGDLSHMNGKIPFDAAQDGDTAAEK